jgi:hypothetical protein
VKVAYSEGGESISTDLKCSAINPWEERPEHALARAWFGVVESLKVERRAVTLVIHDDDGYLLVFEKISQHHAAGHCALTLVIPHAEVNNDSRPVPYNMVNCRWNGRCGVLGLEAESVGEYGLRVFAGFKGEEMYGLDEWAENVFLDDGVDKL